MDKIAHKKSQIESKMPFDLKINQMISDIVILEMQGKFLETKKILDKLLEISDDIELHIMANSLYCLVLVRIGETEASGQYKDKVIQTNITSFTHEIQGWYNFCIGEYYREYGRMINAREYFSKNLSLTLSHYLEIRTKRTLGIVNRHLGNLDISLGLLNEALESAKKTNDFFNQGLIYNSFGNLYWTQKNLRLALNNLMAALNIWENYELNDLEKHLVILNIGAIYKEYGDFQKSRHYLFIAYDYFEARNHDLDLSFIIFEMIQLGIYTSDNDLISRNLIRLEEINYESQNEMINLHLQISKALISLNSPRLLDKVAAYRYLNSIIETDIIYYEITLLAYRAMCDLLLEEYRLYYNSQVLFEFQTNLSNLEELGAKNYNKAVKVDVLLLRGKLLRIKREYHQAKELVLEAIDIAREMELTMVEVRIELEMLSMESEIQDLQKTLTKIKTPQVVQQSKDITTGEELPLMFFISNQTGLTLFQYEFEYFPRSNVNLISSMINAMNGFLQEAFEVRTNIEKIQHNEFYVQFYFEEELAYIYIYRNESPNANERFENIIRVIQNHDQGKLVKKLKGSGPHHNYLDERLESKVLELFVNR